MIPDELKAYSEDILTTDERKFLQVPLLNTRDCQRLTWHCLQQLFAKMEKPEPKPEPKEEKKPFSKKSRW